MVFLTKICPPTVEARKAQSKRHVLIHRVSLSQTAIRKEKRKPFLLKSAIPPKLDLIFNDGLIEYDSNPFIKIFYKKRDFH